MCLTDAGIAGLIASGTVLLFYQEFPSCTHKISKLLNYRGKRTTWFSAAGMITTFIKMDALYNTVVCAAAQIDEFCDAEDIAINVSFLVIIIIVGIIISDVHQLCLHLKRAESVRPTWIQVAALFYLHCDGNMFSILYPDRQPSTTGLCLWL